MTLHRSFTQTEDQMKQEAKERFEALLKARNLQIHCDMPLGISSVSWYWGMTEAGTGWGGAAVTCPVCDEKLAEIGAWSSPENILDAVELLEEGESDWGLR